MVEIKKDEGERLSFSAKSGDERLACATGTLDGTELVIDGFSGEEFLFDGVCRAMISWAEHNGAASCRFEGISSRLLKKIPCDGEIPSIPDFFAKKKCCN